MLDKGGVTSTTQLPSDSVDTLHTMSGITISRSGIVMVVDFMGGNVHLYKIAGVTTTPVDPVNPTNPPPTTPSGGLSAMIRAYVQLIDAFVNSK